MSLLTIINNAEIELGLPQSSTVIGNTANTTKQLLRFAERTGYEIRRRYEWPQLSKEYTFNTVASTSQYTLPPDFDRFIYRTMWDRNNRWELRGPLTAQEWQWRQSGVITSVPRQQFRIRTWEVPEGLQFFLNPTPDDIVTLAFEYISKTWIRPKVWTVSTVVTLNELISYDNIIYQVTSAGTTSATTAPTHTSGDDTNGTATLTVYTTPLQVFQADTDVSLIDEDVISLGVQYRHLRQKDLHGAKELEAEFERDLNRAAQRLIGSKSLHMAHRRHPLFVSPLSVPDTNFGN